MNSAVFVVLVVGWVVNALCLVHMWLRAPGGVGKKLVFSLAHAVPILGSLVYGGLYVMPEAQEPPKGTHVPAGAHSMRGRRF